MFILLLVTSFGLKTPSSGQHLQKHEYSGAYSTKSTNTGRFIMYSGITKMYYWKTVGHVFTKPVETEGTTQNIFFPVSCFSS